MIYKAYALLALTTLMWAGNSIAGKLAVGHASPMVLVTVRWALVMVALYVFKRERIAADWQVMRQRLAYLLFLGALGFTGFSVALYYALVYTTAINASILQGGTPLFVFCASFVLFGSRVGLEQAIGFVISFVGVIVIAARGDFDNVIALDINFGDALMLVAIISYGIYTAALRSKPRMHWTSLMFVLCLGATLASLPMLALEMARGATIVPDLQGWSAIAYIVIFPSLLGQVFYIRAVELIGANRAGLFINLLPIWGAILAVALLGEAFNLYHAVALAIILAGISLAEYGGRKLGKQG
ncbi:DMT family transporter [Eoetvoesiella caeni]|uniref:Drug/metabolite transporter (DMT)-like permease n=1 Tax=Eoetvoesiella caeni TaxID=645616 RepID=A0A366GZZ0_9BURK|nr:DMT family transporter [Eoetvoesiella caeni]MCI2811109.1 DMT family transporter [Eoetvoesiella caeni]NYT56978.1 DMT family transporter [Eoetvoesiella caeni]RBP35140.1 drug/metabolite transporter (DMT)-like permease [Eoetvoesiella caeni]